MSTTVDFTLELPAEAEVQAAIQGQRVLAAHLLTAPETQTIQILDHDRQPHQVELPTSALRCWSTSWRSWPKATPSRSFPCRRN